MRKLLIPDISFMALDENGKPQKVSAGQQLRQIVSAPSRPGEAFTIEEIRQRLPLTDKLAAIVEAGDKEILLEEGEHAVLLAAVMASTWMGVSRTALDLVEAVEKAETVEVTEVEPQESREGR